MKIFLIQFQKKYIYYYFYEMVKVDNRKKCI